jgi:hypothetical protein
MVVATTNQQSNLYRTVRNCHALVMATRSFIADDKTAAGVAAADHASAGTILRYQLDVVAASVGDALRSVGGWMCDRARAGWDVNVMVADRGDR